MGLDYSYTQPSESEDYGENSAASGYSETEFDIMLDQAEIDAARVVYPPQPEQGRHVVSVVYVWCSIV
ncbi:BnaAnng25380D [Brassica napus]|uniref:BnaA02g19430D protein n=1 Tax=Brassica napus TaxID=3708 RepID=A0A078IQ32_BRANA|nr:BnaA02g19430D [Brassica napus]CDY67860.1 BnaAnng25380D [Brassica napus]